MMITCTILEKNTDVLQFCRHFKFARRHQKNAKTTTLLVLISPVLMAKFLGRWRNKGRRKRCHLVRK